MLTNTGKKFSLHGVRSLLKFQDVLELKKKQLKKPWKSPGIVKYFLECPGISPIQKKNGEKNNKFGTIAVDGPSQWK